MWEGWFSSAPTVNMGVLLGVERVKTWGVERIGCLGVAAEWCCYWMLLFLTAACSQIHSTPSSKLLAILHWVPTSMCSTKLIKHNISKTTCLDKTFPTE